MSISNHKTVKNQNVYRRICMGLCKDLISPKFRYLWRTQVPWSKRWWWCPHSVFSVGSMNSAGLSEPCPLKILITISFRTIFFFLGGLPWAFSVYSLPGEHKASISKVFFNDVLAILPLQKQYLLVKIKFRNIINICRVLYLSRCRVLNLHYNKTIIYYYIIIIFFPF